MVGKLLMLGTDKSTTWMVYNELVAQFGAFPIIIENTVSKRTLIKIRAKKIGYFNVLSQIAFVALIRPLLKRRATKRVKHLSRLHGLEATRPTSDLIFNVASVNSDACRELMREHQPEVVVVNGTRIIGKPTLSCLPATFINTHQGITPRYRGAHGAYWALVENRRAECGVTVHLVDEGIDTGNIIAQAVIDPQPEDSYITYPILQTAAALQHLVEAIRAAFVKQVQSHAAPGDGLIWYHPGFFQYIAGALRGVW